MIGEDYRCRVCESPLMGTVSGSVCPEGHGGSRAKLPPAVKRRNHCLLVGVPEARRHRSFWKLPDSDQLYILKRRLYCEVQAAGVGSTRYALDGTTVLVLEPV